MIDIATQSLSCLAEEVCIFGRSFFSGGGAVRVWLWVVCGGLSKDVKGRFSDSNVMGGTFSYHTSTSRHFAKPIEVINR